MKNKHLKTFILMFITVILLTGCKPGKQQIYKGKKLDVIFNVKYATDYKLSEDEKDFRTSREKAVLISDNFKIGIEINEELSNEEFNGDFKKFKEKYKDKEDYTEVKYAGIKGFRIYEQAYARYEIYLPVNNKYIVRFNVYAFTNNKKSTTKILKSKEVKQILKYVEIKTK